LCRKSKIATSSMAGYAALADRNPRVGFVGREAGKGSTETEVHPCSEKLLIGGEGQGGKLGVQALQDVEVSQDQRS